MPLVQQLVPARGDASLGFDARRLIYSRPPMLARKVFHRVEDRVRAISAVIPAALGASWPRLVAPAVVFLALFPFIVPLVQMEVNEPLFGDVAMMQYTAWCMRHGMRLYRDMGSTDGPFIHFLQASIQIFLGESDRALRVGDIRLQALGGALIGAMLAPKKGLSLVGARVSMAVWAMVGVTVWLSYYLVLSWLAASNREAFYSVVGCVSMVALYVSGTVSRRAGAILAFAGGLLGMSMCFGKPTGVIFPCTGALALLSADPEVISTRRLRIRMALYGAAACVVFVTLGLLLFGSIRGYFFWCVQMPFVGNKFIWRGNPLNLILLEYPEGRTVALFSLVVGVVAIGWDVLPRRAIGFVIAPVLHWLSFCAQARGFPHQIVPVYATAHVLGLLLAACLWELTRDDRPVRAFGPVVLLLLGYHALTNIEASPYRWSGDPARWAHPLESFGDPEKQAGAFIKARTKPEDTVYAYTVGPRGDNASIVLYNAERRTASPFHYAPWLDPIVLLPESSVQPNARELAALQALQTRTRDEECKAVLSHRPAAIVYVSLDRVLAVCPPLGPILQRDYHPATVIHDLHVHLRNPGI